MELAKSLQMLYILLKKQGREVRLLADKVPGVIMLSFFPLYVYSQVLRHNHISTIVGPYFLNLENIYVNPNSCLVAKSLQLIYVATKL